MNPVVYGKEHSLYVVISVIVALATIILAKLFIKTEKAKNITMKISGVILFVAIFSNRLALVFEYEQTNWLKLITDSFCSTSSYALSLALIFGKKDNNMFHFLWLVALAGGIITTSFPNFIGQHPNFLYPPTILGLIHHTLSAIIVILMIMFKWVNITYKKWYCMVIGFVSYIAYGAFLMCVLGFGNPFYMTSPAISGTPFTAWVIAPIFMAVYALVLLIIELVRKHKSKKNFDNTQKN